MRSLVKSNLRSFMTCFAQSFILKDLVPLSRVVNEPYKLPIIKLNKKFTVFIDIDETLIYYDYIHNKIYLRDNINDLFIFFKENPQIEIVYWTAGTLQHVINVFEYFKNKFTTIPVDGIIYRGTWVKQNYVKDLSLIRGRTNSIILDNLCSNFTHPHRSILIPSFLPNKIESPYLLIFIIICQKLLDGCNLEKLEKENILVKCKKYFTFKENKNLIN